MAIDAGHGNWYQRTRGATGCRALCLDKPHCAFYSFDTERRCYLCSRCDLRPPSSSQSEDGRWRFERQARNKAQLLLPQPRRNATTAVSFARRPATFVRVGAVPDAVRRLRGWLDGDYATAVYGEGGEANAH